MGQPAGSTSQFFPWDKQAGRAASKLAGLQRQNQALAAAFDRLTFGVLITDGGGRALLLNRAAEEIAAANDGLLLHGGRLQAARAEEAALLAQHIAGAGQARAHRCQVFAPMGSTSAAG